MDTDIRVETSYKYGIYAIFDGKLLVRFYKSKEKHNK